LNKNKEDADAELVISCPRCGTQSRVGVNEAAGDEPPTCPACGTSLEAGAKAREKSKKRRYDFGSPADEGIWNAYWRECRDEDSELVRKLVPLILALCALACLLVNVCRLSEG
jgi:hypothetical protein